MLLGALCSKRFSAVQVVTITIKFRKTPQKVVALVTAALKALLSVTKTNIRLSRCEFCAGNVYYLFRNIIIAHIYPLSAYKKVRPKGTHRKNASPRLLLHKLSPMRNEKREKTLFTKSIFTHQRKYAVCVAYILYHYSDNLSTKLDNLTKYCRFCAFEQV